MSRLFNRSIITTAIDIAISATSHGKRSGAKFRLDKGCNTRGQGIAFSILNNELTVCLKAVAIFICIDIVAIAATEHLADEEVLAVALLLRGDCNIRTGIRCRLRFTNGSRDIAATKYLVDDDIAVVCTYGDMGRAAHIGLTGTAIYATADVYLRVAK